MPKHFSKFDLSIYAADIALWSKVATWSREEIVALSLGKDPRRISWEKICYVNSEPAFIREYDARRMIVDRSYAARHLSSRTAPLKVLQWAKRIGFSMPADLVSAVEALGDISAQQPINGDTAVHDSDAATECVATEKQGSRFSSRERESLLKIIIAMAIKGYAYNPNTRTSTATEIASDLQLLGLSLSDDTIRKFLQEASELLPKSETEQKR